LSARKINAEAREAESVRTGFGAREDVKSQPVKMGLFDIKCLFQREEATVDLV
jgi:hypothetical protein